MKSENTSSDAIDDYIENYPDEVQTVLRRIRETIRKAAPAATQKISYRMPAFFENGVLIYFGAFQNHIGIYPPVSDADLKKECAKFAGEKGNLRLPLDEKIPYGLIAKIVKARLRENNAKLQARKSTKAAKKRK
jgi:uncharacterized protein YdhG (YjbR/CyaY superfamily)